MKKIVLQPFIFLLFLGVALFVFSQKVSACSWSGCSGSYPGYWYSYTKTCTSTPPCTMGQGDCGWPAWPGDYTCNASCGTCTPVYGTCSTSCGTGTKPYDSYNDCGTMCGAGSVPCTVCSPVDCAGITYGNWGNCSSTCGEAGTQSRSRHYTCNWQALTDQSQTCYECDTCGCSGYTTGSWGACSQSCGGGTQTRTVTDNCSGANACTSCGQTCSQSCNTSLCAAPSLDVPTNGATNQSVNPVLKTTATDAESDYLRYKIQICSDSACNTVLQTIDQTSSQTGWSGQNTQSNTAYTSGTQAVYTVQTTLNFNTTYYWRSYRKDPTPGSNSWSNTQGTPYSFTTLNSTVPNTPTLDLPANGATNVSLTPVLKTTGTDPSGTDYLRYKIQICTDSAMTQNCQTFTQPTGSPQTGWTGQNAQSSTAYASGTQAVYTVQSDLNGSTTYYWRSYAIDPGNSNTWSATQVTPYSFTTRPPNCTSIPISGNFTVLGTLCAFPGDVNGVDAGTGTTNTAALIIGQTGTAGSFSVLCNQTIAAGSIVFTNGSINLIKNPDGSSCGAVLKTKTPLYLTDADGDGYGVNTATQYIVGGTGKARRSQGIDYNDASTSIHPGTTCNGDCSINSTTGTCDAVTAGENGLAACKRCNGSSLTSVNVTDNTQDTEGSNVCSATCKKCSSGSCVNQSSSEDIGGQCPGFDCDGSGGGTKYYYGWSNKTCYLNADVTDAAAVCDGAGACKTMAVACFDSGIGPSSGVTRGTCKAQVGCGGTTPGSEGGNVPNLNDPYNDCDPYGCTTKVWGWSGSSCLAAASLASTDGMCNGVGACYTGITNECQAGSTIGSCASSGCKNASKCVQDTAAADNNSTVKICYTNDEQGTCGAYYMCDPDGTCVSTEFCTQCAGGYCSTTCTTLGYTCMSKYSNSSCTTGAGGCAASCAAGYCKCH